MRAQDRVVRFDNGRANLRTGADSEAQLALPPVVDGEALEEEGSESRTGAATGGVEDEEALETGAVVGKLADAIKDGIDDLGGQAGGSERE